MDSTLVSLDRVSLFYHTKQAETQALEELSFSVSEGEFIAIVGPSGCGKTTVLSLIMGLLTPTKGSVTTRDGRQKMGYMLQHDHLLDWRTVEKNVLLSLEVQHGINEQTKQKALALLDRYGLGGFRHSKPAELSGGMRQKVALIRTLATDPQLLLLDEPFSALDYQTRLRIADEVYSIIKQERKTAILVTHDISEAISMADRVLVFSQRPSKVKSEFVIEIDKAQSPLERRNDPRFFTYFHRIWEDLDA
ncbi:MAG: ABC transporter ATP-binding protein [Eubacteriales bacterium]|nr:ABC transporter ATP-binding protein [Eubacteriales bacterium]